MNKHGFTLMEILAVLLVLAVVVSFALPGIRAVRAEIYHSQAKSVASKMADAVRSYYQATKGVLPSEGDGICGRATNCAGMSVKNAATQTCLTNGTDGIPSKNKSPVNMHQLFACKYLSQEDFVGVPYLFTVHDVLASDGDAPVLVTALGTDGAGKYQGRTICVFRDGSIQEDCEL